jgi:hypothetical protein
MFGYRYSGSAMVLEDILLAAAVGVVFLFALRPIMRLVKAAPWRRRDPLAEAQERLRVAQLEAEAARVNRQADKIYEQLYGEALADDRSGAARIAPDEEAASHPGEPTGRGNRHGSE